MASARKVQVVQRQRLQLPEYNLPQECWSARYEEETRAGPHRG
jgi:hypothetical protein